MPRIAGSTGPSTRESPAIGSLVVVHHVCLGPAAQLCRVLGKCLQNGEDLFLLEFLQSSLRPCYVYREYLYGLRPHPGFPQNDTEVELFDRFIFEERTSLDQLLEKVISSAQNLAIGLAEMLFPPEKIERGVIKPTQEQIQQIMFQCVSCAALLIVCYVFGRAEIPEAKARLMVATILKTTPPKYVSTQEIMGRAEAILGELVSSKQY
jgi:hypothetical protein